MEDIQHNLRVAKPIFLYFIKNMDKEISQWIQYNGVESNGGKIFFKFKSSQNSLSFKVFAGISKDYIYSILDVNSNEIYQYFKELKYNNID
jgi:hypothetical protein